MGGPLPGARRPPAAGRGPALRGPPFALPATPAPQAHSAADSLAALWRTLREPRVVCPAAGALCCALTLCAVCACRRVNRRHSMYKPLPIDVDGESTATQPVGAAGGPTGWRPPSSLLNCEAADEAPDRHCRTSPPPLPPPPQQQQQQQQPGEEEAASWGSPLTQLSGLPGLTSPGRGAQAGRASGGDTRSSAAPAGPSPLSDPPWPPAAAVGCRLAPVSPHGGALRQGCIAGSRQGGLESPVCNWGATAGERFSPHAAAGATALPVPTGGWPVSPTASPRAPDMGGAVDVQIERGNSQHWGFTVSGSLLSGVIPGSAADAAGLSCLQGWAVARVNGVPVSGAEEIRAACVGSSVVLGLQRLQLLQPRQPPSQKRSSLRSPPLTHTLPGSSTQPRSPQHAGPGTTSSSVVRFHA
eukprot:TRINITY_DN4751_c1_g1_i1.p1 TRINITY_DN4751_c1_g1~~TRINITY_DN4751_c1_g1_i1.p1  ORF type:complete len:437 (+),score=99.00 TRINITY_DN4751_c1_g1_i1:70-1311(+)